MLRCESRNTSGLVSKKQPKERSEIMASTIVTFTGDIHENAIQVASGFMLESGTIVDGVRISKYAVSYIRRLLGGESIESVVEYVLEDYSDSWSDRVGYWVDCAREAAIQAGEVEGIDDEWRDELQSQLRPFAEHQMELWNGEELRSVVRC